MRAEDDPGLVIDKVVDRGKTGPDPGIVFDRTVPIQGHIEISSHKYPFSANIFIPYSFFLHGVSYPVYPDTGAGFVFSVVH
jgi:hypothetical protein